MKNGQILEKKLTRICQYSQCGKPFQTSRSNANTCCGAHRAAWNLEKKIEAAAQIKAASYIKVNQQLTANS